MQSECNAAPRSVKRIVVSDMPAESRQNLCRNTVSEKHNTWCYTETTHFSRKWKNEKKEKKTRDTCQWAKHFRESAYTSRLVRVSETEEHEGAEAPAFCLLFSRDPHYSPKKVPAFDGPLLRTHAGRAQRKDPKLLTVSRHICECFSRRAQLNENSPPPKNYASTSHVLLKKFARYENIFRYFQSA
jgi:hypothetical protein